MSESECASGTSAYEEGETQRALSLFGGGAELGSEGVCAVGDKDDKSMRLKSKCPSQLKAAVILAWCLDRPGSLPEAGTGIPLPRNTSHGHTDG